MNNEIKLKQSIKYKYLFSLNNYSNKLKLILFLNKIYLDY